MGLLYHNAGVGSDSVAYLPVADATMEDADF